MATVQEPNLPAPRSLTARLVAQAVVAAVGLAIGAVVGLVGALWFGLIDLVC
ncbi:hypothetical protein FHW84_001704 [Dyella sp. SG562]|uniref:hypothetical protein n=1 Tax=unclassified Dyella TaxID=2634549 RepID=UPI0014213F94|nr:hypothetical protein [Dyella sp. SG562]NII73135.1 hypothetical protein [Dyella sp. SG562]